MTSVDWRDELARLAEGLIAHHRNPFHHIAERDFTARVAALSERLPALSDDAAIVGLRSIAAAIGDGHTFIAAPGRPKLPVEFHWFGDDLTVTRATAAHRDLIGRRVLSIGEQPVATVHDQLQPFIPQGENAWYILGKSAELLRESEILDALGIAPVFHFESGATLPLAAGEDPLVSPPNAPLSLQHAESPFWFERLPKHDAVYVQFRSYDQLRANAAPLFAALAERPAAKLIIDLRRNGGGDFWAGRQWLLAPVQWINLIAGELYVLVGRRTFSASMVNAIDFARETEAILVGEPIGARPWGYQENGWFTLPGSQLRVSAATRLYRFGPEGEDSFRPDRHVETTHADFIAGRDPVFDWALGA